MPCLLIQSCHIGYVITIFGIHNGISFGRIHILVSTNEPSRRIVGQRCMNVVVLIFIITFCDRQKVAKQILRLASPQWLLFGWYGRIVGRIVEPRPWSPMFGSNKGLILICGKEESDCQLRHRSGIPYSNEHLLVSTGAIICLNKLSSVNRSVVVCSFLVRNGRKA